MHPWHIESSLSCLPMRRLVKLYIQCHRWRRRYLLLLELTAHGGPFYAVAWWHDRTSSAVGHPKPARQIRETFCTSHIATIRLLYCSVGPRSLWIGYVLRCFTRKGDLMHRNLKRTLDIKYSCNNEKFIICISHVIYLFG
jgi:hypothetical protein